MTRLTDEYNTEHASALLENDDKQNDEQQEDEAKAYNELDETKDIEVGDGYVTFSQSFKYLGSTISYNLRTHCRCQRINGRAKKRMAKPTPRCLQQIPTVPRHPHEPSAMGMRNMVNTTDAAEQTGRFHASQHTTHPGYFDGSSER
jgi:hypothetical protein